VKRSMPFCVFADPSSLVYPASVLGRSRRTVSRRDVHLCSSERAQGGVLVAWGFTDDGERVLLSVMLGHARVIRGLAGARLSGSQEGSGRSPVGGALPISHVRVALFAGSGMAHAAGCRYGERHASHLD
jgi:hypothetical protein